MSGLVYLAGPITGIGYGDCTDWRNYAAERFRACGIRAISPMRGKENLAGEKCIKDHYPAEVLSCEDGIITRDRWDVSRCDVMLVNLLGAKNVSIGTVTEYGWADAYRKPVITVMGKEGNCHDHAMIRKITGFRIDRLDSGIDVAIALLKD